MLQTRVILIFLAAFLGAAQAAWTIPPEYALFVSKDGHYFRTSDGNPFFWQADTAWLMINRLNYTEADMYLADRASKGFNIVQSCGAHCNGIDEVDRQGNAAFIDRDILKPNEVYWQYVDSIIELAWSYGIRVVMHPAWGKYVHDSAGKPGYLDAEKAKTMGAFIGNRYPYLPKILFGDTNPWWKNKTAVSSDYAYGGILSDNLPQDYALLDFSPVYDAFAEGILEGERMVLGSSHRRQLNDNNTLTYEPMLSMHPTNQWFAAGPLALASSFFGDRQWLTFDASQSGHTDYPPNPPIPWWSCRRGWEPAELMYAVGETTRGKKRPAIDNEPHYEWRYNNAKRPEWWNASDVRVGTWQTVFAGMAGLTYGADMVWQMRIPGIYESAGGGPDMPWYEAINLPGSSQMQHIKNAILDRGTSSYFDRIPAQECIVSNPGISDARVAATRDSKGSWLMVYSPNSTFTVETKSLKGCNMKASWLNPLSGEYTPFDYQQCGGSTVHEFQLPHGDGHDDWTLVIESIN